MKKLICCIVIGLLVVSTAALARTEIETNGFFIEGVGYITTVTVSAKNPWGQNVTKLVGYNEKGEKVFDADGSGDGWVNGFWKGGFAGVAQGGGVAAAGALIRPSNYSGGNSSSNSDSGSSATQSQGQGQVQAQLQGQAQAQSQKQSLKNTFTPTNINCNANSVSGGWTPPGHDR